MGDDLTAPVEFKPAGGGDIIRPMYLPDEALPDCGNCEKPELTSENAEVCYVYSLVADQQMHNSFNGMALGLRMEALTAALDWLIRTDAIESPEVVFRRIWILDRIAVKHRNLELERRRKAQEGKG